MDARLKQAGGDAEERDLSPPGDAGPPLADRFADRVLRKCLNWRPGDVVLAVVETDVEPLAAAFREALARQSIEAAWVTMPARARPNEEPPAEVASALKTCDVAVLITSTSLSSTQALRTALESSRPPRIASLAGLDLRRVVPLLEIDTEHLARRCDVLANRLKGNHVVRLVSASGTDLEFRTSGSNVGCNGGALGAPGAFGLLPAGDVFLSPVPGSAHGVAVIDGSVNNLGLAHEPIRLRFEEGRVVELSDPQMRLLLRAFGADVADLREFGVGLNPRASITGHPGEDRVACGAFRLAIGSHRPDGGFLLDTFLRPAELHIDGERVPPELLRPAPSQPPPSPASIDLQRADVYALLFQNSNDAQYVLDLETQRFLEVNAAFEELTGYSRAELVGGPIDATRLVALESADVYRRKQENRKHSQGDRYELKIYCKNGAKRPVELSVRRFTLDERQVVVGSMRDLSFRKKLEQEMWERIEELGLANSRILALTEKLRHVPHLTAQLTPLNSVEELLEKSASLMTAREGLDYANVTFYLLQGDSLETAYSTSKSKTLGHALASDHPLTRIALGQAPGYVTSQEAVLPLTGPDAHVGVIEVLFHPKEIEVLMGNEHALKGYQNLLRTLAGFLGLRILNIQLYEKVKMQSIVDQTTGAYNRRYFEQKFAEEVGRALRYGRDLALVMVDLDNFKKINDTLGHPQGDMLLAEATRLYRSHFRSADLVCRYGGDEFTIIMPETTYENAMIKAESLRALFRDTAFTNLGNPAAPLRLTLSLGVTALSLQTHNAESMLRAADEALLASKRRGRDTVSGRPGRSE
ncbi:MAG: diguanylate cyclase [Planctomycetes bacterium]|nr:diguanylate cyclase [Planctomycetota bacterium]